MEAVRRLPARLRLLLAACVLYFVFSFLDWQQVSALGFTVGRNEWNGVGVVAALLGVALLVWEVVRPLGLERLQAREAGFVSLALALLLALFTLVTFLSHNVARHWPAWVGLVLAALIAVVASAR